MGGLNNVVLILRAGKVLNILVLGVGTPVNTEPCPSTPGPFQSSSGTTSGLTDQLKRVRVASGELEPPSPLPLTSLPSTALTPFDLPKLVMDMPPDLMTILITFRITILITILITIPITNPMTIRLTIL